MSSFTVLYEAAQARMTETYNILVAHRSMSLSPHQPVEKPWPKKRKRQHDTSPAPSRDQSTRRKTRQPTSYAEIDSDDELIYRSDEEYDCPAAARKKAKPLPKAQRFPFLSLPRELRDMIYHYALVDTLGGTYIDQRVVHYRRTAVRIAAGPCDIMSSWGDRCHRGGPMPRWPHPEDHAWDTRDDPDAPEFAPHSQALVPSLLGVCKQVYAEAAPLLYAQPLYFEDGRALHAFLAVLSRPTRGLLRDITLLEDHHGRRSLKKNFDGAAFTLLADGGAGAGFVKLRLADMMGQWLDGHRGGSKGGARRLYRNAWPWLEAMRRQRGVEETVKAVQVIDRDYEVWGVGVPGSESCEEFWGELRRLVEATERNW